MNMLRTIIVALTCVCLVSPPATAQTVDLKWVLVNMDGTNLDVKAQIKSNTSTFALGTSNLFFTFHATNLGNPTILTAHNFSGGSYQAMAIGGTGGTRAINIELSTSGTGTTVTAGFMDVATIRFPIAVQGGASNLDWSDLTEVYKDDEATLVDHGTFTGLNTDPLPVQLSSFTGSIGQNSGNVVLKWSTISEVNNYGFEIQKSKDSATAFVAVANGFVKGHGTTTEPQQYTFTDATTQPGLWYYRLKQIDLNGSSHYSDAIIPSSVTGVGDRPLPTAFALDQNYPNPFNPSTVIEFALPREARVTLAIYNLLGQKVATLVDEVRPAGYHQQRFDARGYASGLYFYRLTAGSDVTFMKKMLLVK